MDGFLMTGTDDDPIITGRLVRCTSPVPGRRFALAVAG